MNRNVYQVVPGITHIFVRNHMEMWLRDLLEMQEPKDIISCVLLMQKKIGISEYYDVRSGGGYPLPSNSTTEALVLLGATIDFIGCWIKVLEHNLIERCRIYVFTMEKLFLKIPVEIPKKTFPKEKLQSLLHTIGGGWYVKKLGQELPPQKKGN